MSKLRKILTLSSSTSPEAISAINASDTDSYGEVKGSKKDIAAHVIRLRSDLVACRNALSSTRISNAAIITSLEREVESIREEIKLKDVELSQEKKLSVDLGRKCAELEQQLNAGNSLRATMEDALSNIEKQLLEEKKITKELEEKLSSKLVDEKGLMESLGKLEAERLSAESAVNNLTEVLEVAKENNEKAMENFTSQIAYLNAKVEAGDEQLKQKELELDNSKRDLKEKIEQARRNEEDFNTKVAEMQETTKKLDEMAKALDDESGRAKMLEHREEKLIIEKKELSDKINEMEEHIKEQESALEIALKSFECKESEMTQSMEALNSKMQLLTSEKELLTKAKSDVEMEMKELRLSVTDKDNELSESLASKEILSKKLKLEESKFLELSEKAKALEMNKDEEIQEIKG